MDEKTKDAMIASVEKVEDFLNDWYSVADLFETAANAGSVLLRVVKSCYALKDDDVKYLRDLIDQHVMVANMLKQFEKTEG